MPTYEYECQRCGTIEIGHSIVDRARSRCPLCGNKVKRLVSGGAGTIIDASGFWRIGRDGKEIKVPRSLCEREWRATAGRSRPQL